MNVEKKINFVRWGSYKDTCCYPEKSRDSNGLTRIIAKVIFNVADEKSKLYSAKALQIKLYNA